MIVVIAGLALFLGLAFLMLRRRNELLQKFLTPEEPELENEFFRIRFTKPEKTTPEEDDVEPETEEAAVEEEKVRWGTSHEETTNSV